MKTKSTLVCFFLFVSVFIINAQTNHQYVLHDFSVDSFAGGNVIATTLTADGGMVVVDGGESRQSISFNGGFSMIKYDAAGNKLWNTYLDGAYARYIKKVFELSGGAFALVGNMSASSGSFILKTDATGNFLWLNSYGDGLIDCALDPLDNGFILTLNGGGNDHSRIVKVNASGAVAWSDSRNYNVNPDRYIKARRLANGNYLAVGVAWTAPSLSYGKGIVACYSSAGALLWSKGYIGPDWVTWFADFTEEADGSLLIGGFSSSITVNGDWPLLTKMDSTGNVLWTKNYGNGTNTCYCSFNFADNFVYVNGNIWGTSTGDLPMAMKMDATGNFMWSHLYNPYVASIEVGPIYPVTVRGDRLAFCSGFTFCNTDTAFTGTCYDRDTTFAAVTMALSQVATTPDTLNRTVVATPYTMVTYTNINFSKDDICTPSGIESVSAQPLAAVSVFPNPFSSSAVLKINSVAVLQRAQLRLFDALGREVKNIPVMDVETIINRDNLSCGIYFYQLINNGVVVAANKLVIGE